MQQEMKVFGIFLMLFGLSQCGSIKFTKNPPFTITSAIYSNWVGGQPGARGITVEMTYKSDSNIIFDSLYFSKRVTKVEVDKYKGKVSLVANFKTSLSKRPHDLILHSDPKREMQNKVPQASNFPFSLKDNEAVMSYKSKGKTRYYKIKNIKKKKLVVYP